MEKMEKKGKKGKGVKAAGNFKRILLPTDFSAVSENALSCARSLAKRHGSKLYVVHVVDFRNDAAGFYVPHLSFDKLEGEMREGAMAMLKRFCSVRLKALKAFEMRVLDGEPYKEILKFSKDENVDLIVMGVSSRGKVDKFFFGSTTERVIRKADRPVMVVPPQAG
ncbi:MAG: universal stress protein [Thermodesulfobacteriota bacterium]